MRRESRLAVQSNATANPPASAARVAIVSSDIVIPVGRGTQHDPRLPLTSVAQANLQLRDRSEAKAPFSLGRKSRDAEKPFRLIFLLLFGSI